VGILVLGIGAYAYFRISSPHLLRRARGVDEQIIRATLEDLTEAVFIQGMHGAENLYLDQESQRVYVTDLQGYVHLLDGSSWQNVSIAKSLQLGTYALGIDRGPDDWLYVGVSNGTAEDWTTAGGALFKLDMELEELFKITENYPALNGVAFDNEGRCYFAAVSTYSFLHPKGEVYMMDISPEGGHTKPKLLLSDVGLANGLHYNAVTNRMYLSNTIERVMAFTPGQPTLEESYLKTQYMEAVDDLCVDSQGNLWMTDPFEGLVKMYDPESKRLIRYVIDGVGQTSSCGFRVEDGQEILYVTELKKERNPLSMEFDGRGILILPLNSLTQLAP
jgi:sugar lactone lactonase YvrE